MTLRVAVDFGTSSTCVAVSVDGREPAVVAPDGQPIVPSSVYAAEDGTLFVGQEAQRQAAIDPARYEPHPKRRIDEGQLLLGDTVVEVLDVIRAVLGRAVDEARRVAGGAAVDLLVLTHPADWGVLRGRVLRQAARGLARELALVAEPVAAAVFYAGGHALVEGAALAVLDVGGGTVDVSVVRRQTQGAGFQVLAARGDPNFGGADVDQVLLDYVGSAVADSERARWRQLMDSHELSDRRRRRQLRQDVRGAKETLSRHAYADIPLPAPFADAQVTRVDLERLIGPALRRVATLTRDTIAEAGLRPEQLAGVFLVGGGSRIPLVARLVHELTGILPSTLDQPETVVARGALRAVDPPRARHVPARPSGAPSAGLTPAPEPSAAVSAVRTPEPIRGRAATDRHRRSSLPWWVAAGVVVTATLVVGIVLAIRAHRPGPPATSVASTPQGRLIAAFDYTFVAPSGWTQSGGDASKLAVRISPLDAPSGGQVVYVQEFPLSYDSTADRDRAVGELRQEVLGAGDRAFTPQTGYAGRTVAYYQQLAGAATVDWYVLFQGRVQVSVGCQYPDGGGAGMVSACQQVVHGMTVLG